MLSNGLISERVKLAVAKHERRPKAIMAGRLVPHFSVFPKKVVFGRLSVLHSDAHVLIVHLPKLKMTNSTEPSAILSHLDRANGSATFSHNGFTVIGAVNGPIEAQRRDEHSEEATVDVIVRPAAGVGGKVVRVTAEYFRRVLTTPAIGTRERHLESIMQPTLRQIILIHNFPRTLIQIVLQITTTPENNAVSSKVGQSGSVCQQEGE